MSEQGEQTPPATPPPAYDPGPDFVEKVTAVVKEVLGELGLTGGAPEPEPAKQAKPRSLRQEEADSEALVNKVLDKLKASEPPAPKPPEHSEPEVSPGPPPKKRRVQTAMWGA